MILLDLSNIFYRCIFQLEKLNNEIVNYQPTKIELLTSMVNEISSINDKFKYDWGRLMICCDGKGNWRYKFFKEYKQKRSEDKAKDERDWDYLRDLFTQVKEDIKSNSNWPLIEIAELEADDVIALITKYSKDDLLILSNDKDLNQLVDGSRIKQFSLMTNDYVAREHHLLNEAILTGDSSDGVPNIFSDDNHFIKEDKTRAKPVTSTIKSFFLDNDVNEDNLTAYFGDLASKGKCDISIDNIIHNYKRNRMMIDLSMIPMEYEPIFKEEVVKAVDIANNNTNHQKWLDNLINNKDTESETDIGDLFDE